MTATSDSGAANHEPKVEGALGSPDMAGLGAIPTPTRDGREMPELKAPRRKHPLSSSTRIKKKR